MSTCIAVQCPHSHSEQIVTRGKTVRGAPPRLPSVPPAAAMHAAPRGPSSQLTEGCYRQWRPTSCIRDIPTSAASR